VKKKAESKWGSGFFNQLSLDMKAMFPGDSGFSATNLKYMKRWYAFYSETVENRQQLADEICHQVGDELVHRADKKMISPIRQQAADELEMPSVFAAVPWFHHVQIFTKSHSIEEALFYINKVAIEGWSRSRLESQMEKQLFLTQGAAITNFEQTLPSSQIQIAKEILKDPYHFGFLSLKEEYAEKDLEDALVSNVTQFLLELGKGFAYVGRQMELRMDDETAFFPDLVFYHIPQKRYVIIELKAVKFEPEFAGKLNFYVTAADKLLRGDGDNESVGLIICKTAKKTIVEWSLKDINKPLGVSTYQLEEVVARTVEELEQQKEKKRK
jgi:predicted nuclease of restriction endonuclease-like (RecB) superfamily